MSGENEVSIDMGSAVDEISAGLGFGGDDKGADDIELTVEPIEAVVTKAVESPTTTEPVAAVATPTALEAPKSWKKEALAEWSKLPAVVQEEALRREENFFQGIEQYKTDAHFGKTLKGEIDPYIPMLQQANLDPAKTVGNLLAAHATLAYGKPEQKMQVVQKLLNDYGIDISALPAKGEAPYVDPALAELQNRFKQVEDTLTATQRREQDALNRQTAESVKAFAADPKHPYFNELINDMTNLIQQNICKNVEEAYDKAVWLNPVTRVKESARLQAEANEQAKQKATQKAEEARKASAANVSTKSKPGRETATLGSIDDTLQETFANIKARG